MIFKLTILFTSDLHGYITPTCYATGNEVDFGLAKLAPLIYKEREKKNSHVLLIDNGDILQGSPLAYYNAQIKQEKNNPIAVSLNHLKYDACIIGNHDFNYGLDYLSNYKQSLDCTLLSCNIKTKDNAYFVNPYIIKNFEDGPSVAVIGVTTKYIPNWERKEYIKDLQFLDAYEETKETVRYIKENEVVDCIIVSYHGGFESSLENGEATEEHTGENQGYQILTDVKGIDVLLTGHQHRSIAMIKEDVAIVQVAHNGKELAKVSCQFEKMSERWQLISKKSELKQATSKACPELIKCISSVEEQTQKWLDIPLGRVKKGPILIEDLFKARIEKHPIVRLINQVQIDATGVDISVTSLGNDVKGFKEHISMRDIIASYPFPNTLVVLEVLGQDIKDALEKTATYFVVVDNHLQVNPKYLKPKPQHYNYDMFDGISYEIHVRESKGRKIRNLTYNGEPLELTKSYQVVMNNYRASGGGNFSMYKHKKVIKEIQVDMIELLATYIQKHSILEIDEVDCGARPVERCTVVVAVGSAILDFDWHCADFEWCLRNGLKGLRQFDVHRLYTLVEAGNQ